MKINKDNFNSEIFQMKMGNVVDIDETDIQELLDTAKKDAYKHLTVKIATEKKEIANNFLQKGFAITDTLVEYIFDFKKCKLPCMEHKVIIRDFREQDIRKLMDISRTAFTYDRFHSDKKLDNKLCDKYYEQWIYNSCNGFADKVLVAEYNGEPVGFTTGKIYESDKLGHLVLSAVSDTCRGLGIYTSMIYEGVKWLSGHDGLDGLLVGTQINNLAVQKAWIKLGFTVYSSEYVMQKYIGE